MNLHLDFWPEHRFRRLDYQDYRRLLPIWLPQY